MSNLSNADTPSASSSARSPPAAFHVLVLTMAAVANFLVFALVSILGPFYPPYATSSPSLHASSFMVGLIFAAYPLAQILTAPVAGSLSARYGRLPTCVGGLFLLTGSTVLFALGTRVSLHVLARFLQGSAGACVNVSAFALVLEVSQALPRDLGVQEVVVGAGCMVGPTLGGFLFESLGFQAMFLALSLLPLSMGTVTLVALGPLGVGKRGGGGREEGERARKEEEGQALGGKAIANQGTEGSGRKQSVSSSLLVDRGDMTLRVCESPKDARPSPCLAHPPSSPPSGPCPSPEPAHPPWWRHPTILLASLALVADAAALGFLDPTLSQHLLLLLNLPSLSIGLLFAVPSLLYSLAALFGVSHLTHLIGLKNTVTTGLVFVSLGFLLLGPAPLPFLPPSLPLPLPPPFLWALLLLSLAFIGLGSALVVVPAVPLMLHALSSPSSSLPPSSPPCPPPSNLKDRIASLYTLTWSIGDAVGPFLGGILTQILPSVEEVACARSGREGGREGCQTSFRWSSSVLGLALLAVGVAVAVRVPSDVMDREEGREGGWEDGEEDSFLVSPAWHLAPPLSVRSLSSSSPSVRRRGEARPLLRAEWEEGGEDEEEGGLEGAGRYHTMSHAHVAGQEGGKEGGGQGKRR